MQKQHISAGQFPQASTEWPKVRIYQAFEGVQNGMITLDKDQAHYLGKVLRKREGDRVGLFNQHAGEWLCEIFSLGKSAAELRMVQQVRPTSTVPPIELVFAPLRKERMAFLVEKAVELGVTHLQPVTTEFTNWKFNADKMAKTIMEAVEQCERVDLPTLQPVVPLQTYLQTLSDDQQVFAAIERDDEAAKVSTNDASTVGPSLVIGPEGGWSPAERKLLSDHTQVQPINLGPLILRAETAAITGLVLLQASRHVI